jgi:hypothetical protein
MLGDHTGGLLSIGKAGKAVTKQLGKTLTSLGESPDKRVLQKVQQSKDAAISVANRSATGRSVAGREKKPPVATSLHSQLGLDTGTFLSGDSLGLHWIQAHIANFH